MNAERFASRYLRAAGVLLIIFGLVHIAATPHIPSLLSGSPHEVYEQAVGPILLNHVLVGILLLPIGYTTLLAAASCERDEVWPTRILVSNTLVVFTLPISIAVFMRRPEYYTAPLFLTAVGLVAVISLLMVVATYVIMWGRRSRERGRIGPPR